jgi:hypothetical protein
MRLTFIIVRIVCVRPRGSAMDSGHMHACAASMVMVMVDDDWARKIKQRSALLHALCGEARRAFVLTGTVVQIVLCRGASTNGIWNILGDGVKK